MSDTQQASVFVPFRKSPKKHRGQQASVTPQVKEFMVDGVPVVLTIKQVKNINMRIKAPDGLLQISAPSWVSVQVVEAFVRERMEWVKKRRATLSESPKNGFKQLTSYELGQHKAQLAKTAVPIIHKWEHTMGVRSKSLACRNMTSRWGSCNPQSGRICLNVQLLHYPPECLEYVIVHELCHLQEKGHGERFKALMDHYLPSWREIRAQLK